jgi:hypothetical protein
MPKRIQRKRTKGWRMPENAVYVGRPTKYGNPYKEGMPLRDIPDIYVHRCGMADLPASYKITREDAVRLYEALMAQLCQSPGYLQRLQRELGGKDLVCWCSLDGPCHVDVLLKFANGGTS